MRFLRALGPRLVDGRFGRQKFRAILCGDKAPGLVLRLWRDVGAIGAHVGDETHHLPVTHVNALVELLRNLHGLARCKTELARGLLLQRAGDVRRGRFAGALPFLDLRDDVDGVFQRLQQRLDVILTAQNRLFAANPHQPRLEGLALLASFVMLWSQLGVQRPILFGDEVLDLPFALDDQAQGHRLHPARREPAAHLPPEQRTQVVPDQPVENAPRLLRVHQVHIDVTGMGKRLIHGIFGDLVEHHPLHLFRLQVQNLAQVPGDGLALTVGVGGEVDGAGFLHDLG